jgi:hypothetical protein
MKRLINITLIVVVIVISATSPYSQTRPRRVNQPSNTLAENSRSRTVERPIETRETPVERPPKHHNWMRILGTAAMIGAAAAAGGGGCTPSRDVIRTRPRSY